MDKRNWKIIYSNFGGMEKKAAELISRELGQYILRDRGVYTIHVLACEKGEWFSDGLQRGCGGYIFRKQRDKRACERERYSEERVCGQGD